MFYKYEIRHSNEGDILYLYLTMKYEFANDFSLEDEGNLKRRTKNFIASNSIPFKGNKVYLVLDGKIVKALSITDTKQTISLQDEYSIDQFMIHIQLDDQSLCEISLREYLLSVLLSKYQEDIPDEVYKAMAILYNTYAYKCMKEEGLIYSNNSFAIYKPISYYRSSFANIDSILERLQNLIQDVNCMFLSYQNQFILPFIHYSNDGETLSNSNYPYLSSVKSLWDLASPYYIEIHDVSFEEIQKKLNITLTANTHITMTSDDHNRKVLLDQNAYTAEEFKNMFQLKSTHIYLIIYSNHLRIITKGWGNSYGLSIFGASEIAKSGGYYYHILRYYFPKVKLLKYIKELS